jgi:hypothetical protein
MSVRRGLLFAGFLSSFFFSLFGLIRGGCYFLQSLGEPIGGHSFRYACLWLMVTSVANPLGKAFREALWPKWPRLE